MLHAIGDANSAPVDAAAALAYTVEHGWAYALTDAGAGRRALRADEEASAELAASLPGGPSA